MADVRFCFSCGSKMDVRDQFCINCGSEKKSIDNEKETERATKSPKSINEYLFEKKNERKNIR